MGSAVIVVALVLLWAVALAPMYLDFRRQRRYFRRTAVARAVGVLTDEWSTASRPTGEAKTNG